MAKGKVLTTTVDINGKIEKSVNEAFNEANKRIEELGKQSKKAEEAAKKLNDGWTVTKGVLANLVTHGIEKAASGLKNLAGSIIDTGQEFSSTMGEVQALSGASGEELQKLEDTAREYGKTTVFSATESAEALKYMALAGWDTEQSTSALGGVLDLAAASGMDLAAASDMVTDYMSAFGMEAEKSAYFADLLAYSQANSNTSAEQLGEAYKNCAANLNAAGQDIETTTSLLAMMANQGLKGSEAGTALTAVMRDMTSKMKNGSIQIGKTSVAVMDAAGNYRDMTDILSDVETATDGMGDAERAMALSSTFTSDSIKGLNLMLNAGIDSAADFEEQLRQSGGAAGDMADIMNDNLSGDLKEMQSGFDELKLKIYDGMEAPMRTAVQFVTDSLIPRIESILPAVLPVFQGIADNLGPILDTTINLADAGFGFLADNIEWLIPVVSGLTGAFAAYKAIMLGITIAQKAKAALDIAQLLVTGQLTAANTALAASTLAVTWPVLAVIAAIGALIAIGVALYRNWDVVKEKAAQLGAFLSAVWEGIKAKVSAMIDHIKTVFKAGFDALVGFVKAPFDTILGLIDKVGGAVGKLWGKITGAKKETARISVPAYAAGGFTNGLSIAGEAGTEAVISFDPAYRAQNLSYWAQAGRMLGADNADFSLTGDGGNAYVDMGGITFAPNITVNGNANKESIMEAIEAEYPEFVDMLERWAYERGLPVYG